MVKSNRDEFPKRIRDAVAARASYQCSFQECRQVTVGPSDESPDAVASVGVAAHIAAAAPGPGARRYDPQQSPEERAGIENAIWLCGNHATLIDRDEVTYTRARLLEMKAAHERWVATELATPRAQHDRPRRPTDLITIGPNIVAVGERVGANGSAWSLQLHHFLVGSVVELTELGEAIGTLAPMDRFVILNADGDGRVLAAAPAWRFGDGRIDVELVVERFPRIRVQDLGADIELVDGDLSPAFRLVRGMDRLPQHLEIMLGFSKGEEWIDETLGSRLAEYLALYGGTAWFAGLLKSEMIRLAAIPHRARNGTESTPFDCVERVIDVEPLAPAPAADRRLPVRVTLEVAGHGRWQRNLKVYVGEYPAEPRGPAPSATLMPANIGDEQTGGTTLDSGAVRPAPKQFPSVETPEDLTLKRLQIAEAEGRLRLHASVKHGAAVGPDRCVHKFYVQCEGAPFRVTTATITMWFEEQDFFDWVQAHHMRRIRPPAPLVHSLPVQQDIIVRPDKPYTLEWQTSIGDFYRHFEPETRLATEGRPVEGSTNPYRVPIEKAFGQLVVEFVGITDDRHERRTCNFRWGE